jgi:hypothetical protein
MIEFLYKFIGELVLSLGYVGLAVMFCLLIREVFRK